MCSNHPGIKLEAALGTLEDKIEHLSSYAHVVHTTEKQVISSRRKNENVFKISKNEKCTFKACKNTVFHCQICKFVGFLLSSSWWLLKLPIQGGVVTDKHCNRSTCCCCNPVSTQLLYTVYYDKSSMLI